MLLAEALVSSAKTDFKTNWPTLQVVIMQKGVQLEGSFPPDSVTTAVPVDLCVIIRQQIANVPICFSHP